MKLLQRPNVGAGLHRSGWPLAMEAVSAIADGHGLLLDDCCIQSFRFTRPPLHHNEAWVGIFHSPVSVNSPCPCDADDAISGTLNNTAFQHSQPRMIGGIALSESLATYLSQRIHGTPFVALKHPTEVHVPQWSLCAFQRNPTLWQFGTHLRDLRAIHRVQPVRGWQYCRTAITNMVHARREAVLHRAAPGEINDQVLIYPRLTNTDYDLALTHSVVLTRPYGISACNVVVECIARGTPLLIDRSAEAEEYMGEDYCLYYGADYTDCQLLQHASQQLVSRRGPWMESSFFSAEVFRAVQQMEQTL